MINKTIRSACFFLVLFACCSVLISDILFAQTVSTGRSIKSTDKKSYSSIQHRKNIERVNKGSVGIISGDIGGTYMRIAADLSSVLNYNRDPFLRLLPISGLGGVGNIEDLLYLRGIDLAIVQADIFKHIEAKKKLKNVRSRVHYITKLFDSELHIIVRENINDIRQLKNKKVNFLHRGSSTDLTGNAVLKFLNIPVISTYFDQTLALEKVKNGELSASIILAGKPSSLYTLIPPGSGLKFLPIPFTDEMLNNGYLPAKLTHDDYPTLINIGIEIPTIASATLLAVYNWPKKHPRFAKVSLLTNNLFSYISDFKKPERHKKWTTTNIIAKVPGWKRFKGAQEWIDRSYQFLDKSNLNTEVFTINKNPALDINSKTLPLAEQEKLFKSFKSYIDKISPTNSKKKLDYENLSELFGSFLKWRQNQ